MIIEYENEHIRIWNLQGGQRGPNFPRELAGSEAFTQIQGRKISGVYVHHSAGGMYPGRKAVDKITSYAIAPPIYATNEDGSIKMRKGKRVIKGGGRGWPGCPYTFVIPSYPEQEDGKLVLYRVWDDDWRTWHTGGIHNTHGVGIVIAGWYASRHDLMAKHAFERPTQEAMTCLEHLVEYLLTRYHLAAGPDTLLCHADVGKPACPGDFVENWVRVRRGDEPILALPVAREDPRPLDAVGQVQAALVELGYDPGTLDGLWGPFTANALRSFQLAEGLRADGIFGPISRQAMRQALAR